MINVHPPGLNINCSWEVRHSHSLRQKWLLKQFMLPEWWVQYCNISRVVCIETYTIETGCSIVRTPPPLHDCVPQWGGVLGNIYALFSQWFRSSRYYMAVCFCFTSKHILSFVPLQNSRLRRAYIEQTPVWQIPKVCAILVQRLTNKGFIMLCLEEI